MLGILFLDKSILMKANNALGSLGQFRGLIFFMEPTRGFEPRTCCLRYSCSTVELDRHYYNLSDKTRLHKSRIDKNWYQKSRL